MNAPETVATGHPRALQLLERIEARGLDAPDDPLGFETRLAEDNGWTLGYAIAVAAEYRRFLVLTQLAKHPVSPSRDVDQAWHLHLTRTVHYAAFCDAVFGRFLHHEPARAGDGEVQRHREMHDYTRTVYRRGFGAAPPEAIWPTPGKPLPPDPVDVPRWTVPALLRPGSRLGWASVVAAWLASFVLGPLLGGSAGVFLVEALVMLGVTGWVVLKPGDVVSTRHRRDVLEPYEVAWFAGAAPRMAMTAIVALLERGILRQPVDAQDTALPRHALAVDRGATAPARHPVEAACLRAATDAGLLFADACRAVKPLADACERRLAAARLIADRGTMPRGRARALLLFTLWLAVCFARCRAAFAGGQFGELVIVAALSLVDVSMLLHLARRPTRVAARAEQSLRDMRLRHGQFKAVSPVGDALALGVALAGAAAFAGDLRFAGLDGPFGALGPPARLMARKKAQEHGSGDGNDSGFGSMFGGLFDASCGGGGSSCGGGAAAVDAGGAGWSAGDVGGGGDAGGSSCSAGSSCGSSCSGGSSCGGGGGSSD
ncbi:TIGR04222 domain-containing membrane protein [Scleromatobacter humisilvae]|uniref:TIGR04222 domain-containing membrane protein n=1 Tax=Scleromatobacter humisilvae TaxID=2897159 RepID=A0A9X2BZ27_9BURK|nr:TIGR04222 domain-containing membrane protein [Scleromatobacter humisilvae]MCK9684856.1 TIGR04222 domain-containing membrane protein [Scleromatobacter humisilvae]